MKFNQYSKNASVTTNHEGARAYEMDTKMALYSLVVTSTLEKTFYEGANQRMERLRSLIETVVKEDPTFVARLAVYARNHMNLRSVPLVLAVELARHHKGDDLVRRTLNKVIQRADELTELLAYYQQANGRKGPKKLGALSKQVQYGIADAFNRFDAYQFAKYNRDTEVRLRDALFLAHPVPKDDAQQALFDKIATESLESPETWEVALTRAGQAAGADEELKEVLKRGAWEEMVRSGKLGYMAMLRNLRNLLESRVSDEVLAKVAQTLADPVQVRRSRQLPFRFLSAYRELQGISSTGTPVVLQALEAAMTASAANIAGFGPETRVLIAGDTSGSMGAKLSARSVVQLIDVGLVLAVLLRQVCQKVITGVFGTEYATVQVPEGQVLSAVETLKQTNVGWATNGHLVVEHLIRHNLVMDKVMLFTDLQLWDSGENGNELSRSWKKYKQLAPQAKLYLFDLAGYGHSPMDIRDGDVYLLAGWSDKVFDLLAQIENGGDALAMIDAIEI